MSKKPSRDQRKKHKERELKRLSLSGITQGAKARSLEEDLPRRAADEAEDREASPRATGKRPRRETARASDPPPPPAPKKKTRPHIILLLAGLIGVAAIFAYFQFRPSSSPDSRLIKEEKSSSFGLPKPAPELPTGPPIDSSPPTIVTAPPPRAIPSVAPPVTPAVTAVPQPSAAPKPAAPKKPTRDDTYN